MPRTKQILKPEVQPFNSALSLVAGRCAPLKKEANAQANSANAHIAFYQLTK